jgi:ABC-type multidrug transport system permease subunit
VFLDEPTTSLDSYTALALCTTLKALAHSGTCTVVCTIHQPQSKIFALFDDLLLLSQGRVVYHGNAAQSIDAFAAAGHPLPPMTNPADHLLDVIVHHPDITVVSPSLMLSPVQSPSCADIKDVPVAIGSEEMIVQPLNIDWSRISWFGQFQLLFRRATIEIMRSKRLILAQIMTTVVSAVLIGTAFLQIGSDQNSVTRRQPVMFFCAVNQGVFGALLVINSFPSERVLVLRERAAGTYCVSAYLMATSIATSLQHIIAPILFSCIVYWLVGLQADAAKFFGFMVCMILCTLASTSMAFAISTICRTTTFSLTVLPFVLEIFRLFGGYFLSPANLPAYFSWLDALSVNKYTYVGVALNELNGLHLHCTPAQLTKNGTTCPITSGQYTINQLGLNKLSYGVCVIALAVMIVGYRFIAYLGLRFVKW